MNALVDSRRQFTDMEFSYSQFLVYDSDLEIPACDWTENHSRQGFARRDRVVAVGTLLEFGKANLTVIHGKPSIEGYERVLSVPLEIKSKSIAIDGPEETPGARTVNVENGHYKVTIAQRCEDDEREEIAIWLEKVELRVRRSELLVVDEALDPPTQLIETANIP